MSSVERDPIHLAAADWFARLQEPEVSLEEMLEWQQWMNQDDRHAQAFASIEEVSCALRFAKRPRLAPQPLDARDQYDGSVPLSEWHGARRSPVRYVIAASITVMAIGIAWTMVVGQRSSELVRTAVGENRTVSLADGSRVTLGGNSELEVEFSERARHVELSRGEALFEVAKDPSRPFKVEAGDATVVAVGTQFNVRRGSDRVVVAVIEGRVVVEPARRIAPLALLQQSKPKRAPISVIAGEQTIVDSTGIDIAVPSADPAAATAWQTGRLTFRHETLFHVLEDVNRYAEKPIEIEDEGLRNLRMTATVVDGNVEGLVGSLEKAFGLKAVTEADRIVLRRRD